MWFFTLDTYQECDSYQLSISHDSNSHQLCFTGGDQHSLAIKKKKKVTLGRSVHSGQFSNLGWELRTLGPISWFHFCCSQNPSPSSSTQWTEDLGGSILFFSLKPATRSRKHQAPLYGFQQVHTVHLQATQPGK